MLGQARMPTPRSSIWPGRPPTTRSYSPSTRAWTRFPTLLRRRPAASPPRRRNSFPPPSTAAWPRFRPILARPASVSCGLRMAPTPRAPAEKTRARLAVVGAHLSGMPLNWQLTDRKATLVRPAKTAACYRLYALPGTVPPKPGMVRVADGKGVSIELEIWEMSLESFGSFVAAIPSPLGIGVLQLEDGTAVQGFLCESLALEGAKDISEFRGWRAFLKSQ